MNDPEWLRAQLRSFTCPACGRAYGESRIRLLAERDGLFFVDLDCLVCASRTVAIVTIELDDAEAAIADLSTIQPQPAHPEHPRSDGPTIGADDVLEMHEFLAAFNGDMRQLLGGPVNPLRRGSDRA